MYRAELVVALGLVAGALLLVREALRLPIAWTAAGPGPGFFPFWLAVGVTASAVAVLVKTWRAGRRGAAPFIPAGAWKPLLIVFLPMVAVVALIHYLGIYLGGAVYLAGYMRLVGRHRWAQVAAVSVALPLVLFLIFERWFLMPMPKGVALEWLLYGR
ncbi:MAG: tripartite tricarboxylate transporter TctB family protein [Armatimonadota bacterium]|nr:tripartite tricarboxylate transporter TctB family protein [Armatimonadota bacterium]MDR7485898.1 tripartite tricarboxylate transporter TctB family protein [Armatimonadota bacterium]MDR7533151.1 tripartite tricarboxylate transporter TctB family protein [Armatimonadota bacterium]MDR7536603.1 tripartite tricarboxylate transporter TctB family protein [Armatimonadota bacterium]